MELSSLLVRNVNYEIPSLKKQIAKCQQLQHDYSRKEEEGQAGAAEMREQFHHSCKQYGITVSVPQRAGRSLELALVQGLRWWASFSVALCLAWVCLTFLQSLDVSFDLIASLIASISHHA